MRRSAKVFYESRDSMKHMNLVTPTLLSVRLPQSQPIAAEAAHLPAKKLNLSLMALALLFISSFSAAPTRAQSNETAPVRDPKVAVDAAYTAKIKEYTTETFFASSLVDYLPASKTVPTPKEVLGDIAGAPGILPYSAEVYRYMRMLEKASPRVKVFVIGKTEEGRDMIAVAVSSEENLKHLDENRAKLARL